VLRQFRDGLGHHNTSWKRTFVLLQEQQLATAVRKGDASRVQAPLDESAVVPPHAFSPEKLNLVPPPHPTPQQRWCLCLRGSAMNLTSTPRHAGNWRLPICHKCFWKQSKRNWMDGIIKLQRIIGFGLLFKYSEALSCVLGLIYHLDIDQHRQVHLWCKVFLKIFLYTSQL